MNIIQLQDRLKDFSEQQLVQEMQSPSGSAPQYLVLSELERRKKAKDRFKAQQQPESTVAEETVMQAARTPTGIMGMKRGGVVKASNGYFADVTNNPGNIRPGGGFIGEMGSESGFATFTDPSLGIRALARLPVTYAEQYGINTVKDFVSRYAPRSENEASFDNYVNALSRQLGVSPTDKVDFTDPSVRQIMLPAIMNFEQGAGFSDRYDPSMISAAVRAADLDDPREVMTALGQARSPDETATAPNIPFIASAQASTGDASDTPILDALGIPESSPLRTGVLPERTSPPSFRESATAVKEMRDAEAEEPPLTITQAPIKRGGLPSMSGSNLAAQARKQEEAMRFLAQESFAQKDSQKEAMAQAASAEAQQKRAERGPQAKTNVQPADGAELAGAGDVSIPNAGKETEAQSALDKILQLQKSQTEQAREDEQFNRYLALAQMGAALASSKSPTLLGAAGEAIQTGLPALAESRKGLREAEKEELATQLAVEKIRQEAKAKGTLDTDDRLRIANAMYDDILTIEKEINRLSPFGQAVTPEMQERIDSLQSQIYNLQANRQLLIGGLGFNVTSPIASAGQSPEDVLSQVDAALARKQSK